MICCSIRSNPQNRGVILSIIKAFNLIKHLVSNQESILGCYKLFQVLHLAMPRCILLRIRFLLHINPCPILVYEGVIDNILGVYDSLIYSRFLHKAQILRFLYHTSWEKLWIYIPLWSLLLLPYTSHLYLVIHWDSVLLLGLDLVEWYVINNCLIVCGRVLHWANLRVLLLKGVVKHLCLGRLSRVGVSLGKLTFRGIWRILRLVTSIDLIKD